MGRGNGHRLSCPTRRDVKLSTDLHGIVEESSVSGEREATSGDDGDQKTKSLFEVGFTRRDVIERRAFFGVAEEVHIAILV